MAKAKYINLFINEKVYENETGAFYRVISGIKQTGKTPLSCTIKNTHPKRTLS
mgnify:CR=1 FL=1